MKYLWADTDIRIPDVTNTLFIHTELWVVGTALRYSKLGPDHLSWKATVLPHGWLVEVSTPTGKREQFQGATFNLILEVASAIRRFS